MFWLKLPFLFFNDIIIIGVEKLNVLYLSSEKIFYYTFIYLKWICWWYDDAFIGGYYEICKES